MATSGTALSWRISGRALALAGAAAVAFLAANAAYQTALRMEPALVTPVRDAASPHMPLAGAEGQGLLARAQSKAGALALLTYLETQTSQAYCGPASIVSVLNAMQVPAPVAAPLAPHPYFTQDNLFATAGPELLDRATVERRGMSLSEVAAVFARFGAEVRTVFAADVTLDAFRAEAAAALAAPGRFVVVNYHRAGLGQEGRGHISPLGAYDAASDRFLLLDVSRYKHPPAWVPAAGLYAAMAMETATPGQSRGYLIVASP